MEFPAFRDAKWLHTVLQQRGKRAAQDPPEAKSPDGAPPAFWVPAQVLDGVSICPQQMCDFDPHDRFKRHRLNVQTTIRQMLFRQALFKIQNVEVMYLNRCKRNRVLLSISKVHQPLDFPWLRPKGVALLSEEEWVVERCQILQTYRVRYYREGDNGYSCKVFPRSVKDMLQLLRYSVVSRLQRQRPPSET